MCKGVNWDLSKAKFNFSFTGTIGLNGLETKNPYFKEWSKGKNEFVKFNLSVIEARNNRAFCEAFGMKTDEIKTLDNDGNEIAVSWDDSTDKDVVKSVASYKKNVVSLFVSAENKKKIEELNKKIDLTDDDSKKKEIAEEIERLDVPERKEFITTYQMIQYLAENADKLKDMRVTVTGQVKENVYNGNISQRFEIQNIYAASKKAKNQLKIMVDLFWSVDGFDFADFRKEKKMYINGYVDSFIDKNTLGTDKGRNYYVPMQVLFDVSRVDWDNEKMAKRADFLMAMIGVTRDGDKLSTKLKKNKVYRCPLELAYVNGNDEIPFTEDMLTPAQKMAVEMGYKTIDECRPKGTAYSERIVAYKYNNIDLRDEAANGCYDSEITVKELEEDIFVPVQHETLSEVMEQVEEKVVEKDNENEDFEDIFS